MSVFIRVWRELNLDEVQKGLFVIGELKGECFACHNFGIDLKARSCPHCHTSFRYIAFRRKIDNHSLKRFRNEHPEATFIEFEDFKKATSKKEARRLLDI